MYINANMEGVLTNVNGTAFLDKGVFINKELLEQCVSYVTPFRQLNADVNLNSL